MGSDGRGIIYAIGEFGPAISVLSIGILSANTAARIEGREQTAESSEQPMGCRAAAAAAQNASALRQDAALILWAGADLSIRPAGP
jgi:hypothetical protein